MINKDRYIGILAQILNEHYDEIKRKNTGSKDRQQYIDGYLTAARALDVFDYEELKDLIDKIHFEAFGKTIEERRKSELVKSGSDDDSLDIPTYIRKNIILES
jgi:hypothetical protein